ncbi:MAG: Fe-S-containing hydro-lyase [Breznakia sp.]
MKHITTPLTKEKLKDLVAGEQISISGTMYTARDAAHKRLIEMIKKGETLPFDVNQQIIYYVGPTPAKAHKVIGSAGPTTALRMDAYAGVLYDMGLAMSIGKGYRTQAIVDNIQKNGACYGVAIGGLGALLSQCIKKSEVIAFADLKSEAIRKLEVENFPLTIAIDGNGNNVYKEML